MQSNKRARIDLGHDTATTISASILPVDDDLSWLLVVRQSNGSDDVTDEKRITKVSSVHEFFKMGTVLAHMMSFMRDKDRASLVCCNTYTQLAGESPYSWPGTRIFCPSPKAWPRSVLVPVSKMILLNVVLSGCSIVPGSRKTDVRSCRKRQTLGYSDSPPTTTVDFGLLFAKSRHTLRSLDLCNKICLRSDQLLSMLDPTTTGFSRLTSLTITQSPSTVKALASLLKGPYCQGMCATRHGRKYLDLSSLTSLTVGCLTLAQAEVLVCALSRLNRLSITSLIKSEGYSSHHVDRWCDGCEEHKHELVALGQLKDFDGAEALDRMRYALEEQKGIDSTFDLFRKTVAQMSLHTLELDSVLLDNSLLDGPIKDTLRHLTVGANFRSITHSEINIDLGDCTSLETIDLNHYNIGYARSRTINSLCRLPRVHTISSSDRLGDDSVLRLASIPSLTKLAINQRLTHDMAKAIASARHSIYNAPVGPDAPAAFDDRPQPVPDEWADDPLEWERQERHEIELERAQWERRYNTAPSLVVFPAIHTTPFRELTTYSNQYLSD